MSVPGALAAAIVLTLAIPALVRRAKLHVLATLPVAPEHAVEPPASGLRVAEYWSLPTDGSDSRRDFERRVDHRREQQRIPAAIFPRTR